MERFAIGESSGAKVDPETHRFGDRVLVGGRDAAFVSLTPSHAAAVIRYQGERNTRVVSLRKLRLAGTI
jgi:hypothetical protein